MDPYRLARVLSFLLALAPDFVSGVEIQGHRGARGLYPENTLPSFAAALSIGVDVLELDTAVSADGVVVVSHDPQLSPDLARGPDGRWLTGTGSAIAALTVEELKRFDVGRIRPDSDYARRFPEQTPVDGSTIPTLEEVIALVTASGNDRVRFNIETKVRPGAEAVTWTPEAFAERLATTLRTAGIAERSVVQSFYWRTLAYVNANAPEIETACLTSEQGWLDNVARSVAGPSSWTGFDVGDFRGSVPRMVKAAGCAVWSPYFGEVTEAAIGEARDLGLRVVVWTVNATADMKRLAEMEVNGIITDYPDRLRAVLEDLGLPLPAATPVTAGSGLNSSSK